jgi:hypothetical protein
MLGRGFGCLICENQKRQFNSMVKFSHRLQFLLLLLGPLVWSNSLAFDGGTYFMKRARAEVNGSYFRNRADEYHSFIEMTANASFGISLTKGLEAGIQSRNVFARSTRIPPARFFLLGGYAQYDFLSGSPHRFYLEATYSRGDYCPCGQLDFRRERVRYAGGAIGTDYHFGKKGGWSAGAALVISKVLGADRGEGDFNYLRIGVSYTLGRMN